MNDKKICFIMCVNDKLYEEECIRYIQKLNVPEGYEVEQLSIWDAPSMAAGYNEGMRQSDAKYKVYLHQDVFVVYQNFIYEFLKIFSQDSGWSEWLVHRYFRWKGSCGQVQELVPCLQVM